MDGTLASNCHLFGQIRLVDLKRRQTWDSAADRLQGRIGNPIGVIWCRQRFQRRGRDWVSQNPDRRLLGAKHNTSHQSSACFVARSSNTPHTQIQHRPEIVLPLFFSVAHDRRVLRLSASRQLLISQSNLVLLPRPSALGHSGGV